MVNVYKTDVLIVGSGMVGSSLAIALASVGFKVVLIDQVEPEIQLGNEFDGRASAVAAAGSHYKWNETAHQADGSSPKTVGWALTTPA